MKVLIITDEVWNDKVHGNNVITNWFEGFEGIETANIYCSPGLPDNKCCQHYFQITDAAMLKSIFTKKRAGVAIYSEANATRQIEQTEEINVSFYAFMKKITTESIRAFREWVWMHGKYDTESLNHFVQQFRPDVIYSIRYASRKLLRLERIVKELTAAPMVAFTGDDEYSLQQFRITPVYWVRRFLLRRDLRQNMGLYSKYLFLSEEQAKEYRKLFQVDTECIFKNAVFDENLAQKETHTPVKLVYAGKLYCNRWKVLARIGDALKKINKDEVRIILDIYTKDSTSKRQYKRLHDGKSVFLKGAVPGSELPKVYNQADIALHVESSDLKNRLNTRYSFSTKIIDCLASGCAVMAVCWEKQSGYTYLEREGAAICINDEKKIENALCEIVEASEIIQKYRLKAWECGRRNHQRKQQQKRLYEIFQEANDKQSK